MSYISFTDVMDIFDRAKDMGKTSLPQFAKASLIESPNFMQESLAEEPIVNDIIKNLYNVYIGYILIAMQMDQLVVGNRKVRDLLGTVSTAGAFESFIDSVTIAEKLSGSTEAYRPSSAIKTTYEERQTDEEKRLGRALTDDERRELAEDFTREHNVGADGARHAISPDKAMNLSIASGRQLEISFAREGDAKPVTVMVNVKFNTRLIPEGVVAYIMSQDFNRSIVDRWLQFRAGEIRFVKDFVFGVDKLQRRTKALKYDKDHALQDIFREQSKSSFKHMARLASVNNSYNLANSILMVDEATAKFYMKKVGFDLNRLADRRRFFANTYNLFIVLVDTRYSRVTIYTNGIDESASYSFNEIKSSASSEKMSLKEVMDYLSKAQMPRF